MPTQPILASYPPMPQFYDPVPFVGYPIARSSQDTPETQSTSDTQSSPASNVAEPTGSSLSSTSKEHIGYYVTEQPQVRSLQEYAVGAIPSFSELAQRKRRVSPDITQPLLNTALRRVSRSPSPLRGHVRNESTGAPIIVPNPGTELGKARVDFNRPPPDLGPVIANGSFPTPPRNQLRNDLPDLDPMMNNLGSEAIGAYASPAGLQQHTQQKIKELQARQQLVLEEMQRQNSVNMMGLPVVNSSMKGIAMPDANDLGSIPVEDHRRFPDVPEDIMNYHVPEDQDFNIDYESSKRDMPPWRATALPNGLSALDTVNAPRAPPQEIKTATLPLLSPVFEKRTPSPTASRHLETNKSNNGIKGHNKEHHQQGRRASLPKPSTISKDNGRSAQNKPNDKPQKSTTAANSAAQWQSSQGRRKKNNIRKKTPEQKPTGEPLPPNISERKGG